MSNFIFYRRKLLLTNQKRPFSDFQKFFNISLEDKPTKSKLLSYYNLIKRKPHYKGVKSFVLCNFVLLFGLLIMPGSKIGPQYKLKLLINDIYSDCLMTIATISHSTEFIDYVAENTIESLMTLTKEGIYEIDYTIKNINRLNRLLEENQKSESLIRIALLNMGGLLKYIGKEQNDSFLVGEFKESLMDFLGFVIQNSNFRDSYLFLLDRSNLLNETKHIRFIDSYKEIINVINVLLGYQKEVNLRCQVYEKLMVLLQKESNFTLFFKKVLKVFKIVRYLRLKSFSLI